MNDRREFRKSIFSYAANNNTSVAESIANFHPQIPSLPSKFKSQNKNDLKIIECLTKNQVPAETRLTDTAEQLSLSKKIVSLLIQGFSYEIARNKYFSKKAKSGGRAKIEQRVLGIKKYLNENIQKLCPTKLNPHTPYLLNNYMDLADDETDKRLVDFKISNMYLEKDIAWLSYCSNDFTPIAGLSVYIRSLIQEELFIKVKVLASFTDKQSILSAIEVRMNKKDNLTVKIHHLTPLDLSKIREELLSKCLNTMNVYAIQNGYNDYKDLLTSKQNAAFTNLHLSVSSRIELAIKTIGTEDVSSTLYDFEKYINDRKTFSFGAKKKAELVKTECVKYALRENFATITDEMHRPNFRLLDCGDIRRWDYVAKILEEQRKSSYAARIKSLYAKLEADNVVSLRDDGTVSILVDSGVYHTAIIRELLNIIPSNLSKSLFHLFNKDENVMQCFTVNSIKRVKWNKSVPLDKHFEESHMNVFAIDFKPHTFYVPANLLCEFKPSNSVITNYTNNNVLTMTGKPKSSLDDVCKKLNIYQVVFNGIFNRPYDLSKSTT